jgi:phosphate transport system substrate-binding protein
MKTRNTLSTGLITIGVFASLFFSTTLQLSAIDQKNQINIRVEKSLTPLAQGWINEFTKINPQYKINLINEGSDESTALKLFEHYGESHNSNANKVAYLVGQQAILPVINDQNPYFAKELKRGVRQNQLKEIFFNEETEWLFEQEEMKEPEYEIYTPVPQSSSAEAFSGFFNMPSSDLKGIYVSGDDSHILSALLQDPAGITYSKLSLIYDTETREPISGIRILPVDLNNNGRLDKNELIYENLDQVIQFTGNSRKPLLPTIQIILATEKENLANSDINHFLNWVIGEGQKVNTQLGYFSHGEITPEELTQK